MVDRLVQQMILQVLDPIFDPTFSNSSYFPAQNSWLKVIVFIASASGYVLGRTESKRES